MIAASAPPSNGAKQEKPSFAKIAAAGLNPPKPSNNNSTIPKSDSPSSLQDGAPVPDPSNGNTTPPIAPKPKKIVQMAEKDMKTPSVADTAQPEVHVQPVDTLPPTQGKPAPDGLLMPSAPADEAGTQLSSSDSNKPGSLDGKSSASGTTFAIDEKESLRPDDSASLKAVEDEDVFSAASTGVPGSRMGSDDGVRAFRDQLREISLMEPSRRAQPIQGFGIAPKGVLYVPPSGPGIGMVPNPGRGDVSQGLIVESPPDPKLLEALDNPQDRIWVLKLEQDVIDFVKDAKEHALTLPQCNSFYRLLAHRMADYYMLDHLVDDSSSAVRLYKTQRCRIPPPLTGVATPSTAASTPPPTAPQMKILRRGTDKAKLGGGPLSSDHGDESNEDEKKHKTLTREEREAKYEAARLRIMGSARPSESPEAAKEKQDSRSSSTAGKKSKKKSRADSDDDFEARSAYSNYVTSSFGSDGMPSTQYSFAFIPNGTGVAAPGGVYGHVSTGVAHHASLQGQGNQPWTGQPYHATEAQQHWNQSQHRDYDLATHFQRSLSFSQPNPAQNQSIGYNTQFTQPYYGAPQAWSQSQFDSTAQGHHGTAYGFSNYPMSPNQAHEAQPYAYGQLPSQNIPGRPPSNLEHPLPGSYKSKHFNPQSQSFVPGQADVNRPGTFTPQARPVNTNSIGSGYVGPAQLQRQGSSHSHTSPFGTPALNSPAQPTRAIARQPMTHPLPQPVFARQASPNVPLPPKPTVASTGAPVQAVDPRQHTASAASPHHQSVTAKWGTPASLPAKPPPPAHEAPLAQPIPPRPSVPSAAAVARQSSNGGAGPLTFGSMPSSSPAIVNGSAPQQVGKRS